MVELGSLFLWLAMDTRLDWVKPDISTGKRGSRIEAGAAFLQATHGTE